MRLTTYTDYSLRVLIHLAQSNQGGATISELSDFYKISRNHLVKVVHRLGLLGYIETTRGRTGGIKLAIPANQIKLGDVVEQTEPDSNLLECLNPGENSCVIDRQCRLKGILSSAKSDFIKGLNKYSLHDFSKPKWQTENLFKSVAIQSA